MDRLNIRNQSGAALVVGLIVLLTLTVLGLSSMGSMTTELKIANNLQDYNSAFQAADAGLEEAQNDATVDWLTTDPNFTQTVNYVSLDNTSTAVAEITYRHCRPVTIASSLKVGYSWKGLVHEIRSNGAALNTGGDVLSENTQVLGIQTIRPDC